MVEEAPQAVCPKAAAQRRVNTRRAAWLSRDLVAKDHKEQSVSWQIITILGVASAAARG
jgi:hypothetical protein